MNYRNLHRGSGSFMAAVSPNCVSSSFSVFIHVDRKSEMTIRNLSPDSSSPSSSYLSRCYLALENARRIHLRLRKALQHGHSAVHIGQRRRRMDFVH